MQSWTYDYKSCVFAMINIVRPFKGAKTLQVKY